MARRTLWITVGLILQILLSWGVTLARLSGATWAVAVASTTLMILSVPLVLNQDREVRKAQTGTVRRIMTRRLQGLVGHFHRTAPDEHIRANVMVADPRAQVLKVFAHTGLSPREVQTVWAKGQGICGVAWEEGLVQIGPGVTKQEFEDQRARNHSTPWNITVEQCEATQGLRTIASLPLRPNDDDGQIIGILNFDSRVDPSTSILAEVLSSDLYKALDLADLLTSAL